MFRIRFTGCCLLALTLTACGSQPAELKPEEVLRRTVIAGRMLDSVSVTGSGSLKFVNGDRTSAVRISAAAVIHTGGAWSLNSRTTINRIAASGSGQDIVSTFSSPGGGLIYLRLESLLGPGTPVVQRLLSGSTAGQWWLLAGNPSMPRVTAVTAPAAQDIGAFLSAFRIVRNEGMGRIGGRRQYHYAVEASASSDAEAGSQSGSPRLTGEVWIDAENFSLMKAVWHFADIGTSIGLMSGNIMLDLHDQNHAPDLIVATGSGIRFPLQEFLGIFL